jgi:hypothetical protein
MKKSNIGVIGVTAWFQIDIINVLAVIIRWDIIMKMNLKKNELIKKVQLINVNT